MNALHKATTSFALRDGIKVSPEPAALLAALAEIAGNDGAAYAARKQHQVDNLGVDEARRFKLNMTFEGSDDDLEDGFLGLRPLRVVNATLIERRFDIDLPVGPMGTPASDMIVNFEPRSPRRATLTVSSTKSGLAASFDCEALVAGVLPKNKKLLLRSEFLDFQYSGTTWRVAPRRPLGEFDRIRPSVWRKAILAMHIIQQDDLKVTAANEEGTLINTVGFITTPSSPYEGQLRFMDAVLRLLSHLGMPDEPLTVDEINSAMDSVGVLNGLLLDNVNFRVRARGEDRDEVPRRDEPALMVNSYSIFGRWWGVVSRVSLSIETDSEGASWRAVGRGALAIEQLRGEDLDAAFEDFRQRMGAVSGIELMVAVAPSQHPTGTSTLFVPASD